MFLPDINAKTLDEFVEQLEIPGAMDVVANVHIGPLPPTSAVGMRIVSMIILAIPLAEQLSGMSSHAEAMLWDAVRDAAEVAYFG